MDDIELRSPSGDVMRLTRAEASVLLMFLRWDLKNRAGRMSEEGYRAMRSLCEEFELVTREPS